MLKADYYTIIELMDNIQHPTAEQNIHLTYFNFDFVKISLHTIGWSCKKIENMKQSV